MLPTLTDPEKQRGASDCDALMACGVSSLFM